MSDLTVKALTPALAGDFLRFFDHERGTAFADNPEWAKMLLPLLRCRCDRLAIVVGRAERIAMQARIEVGEMEGFLAFAGSEPVGWLNAQPRH